MRKDQPAILLQRLLDSPEISADVAEWVRGGFRDWLGAQGQLSLTACLGIPAKPKLVLVQIRNVHLREAAALMGGPAWTQALNLHSAIQRFIHKWRLWSNLATAPDRASPVERCLFNVFRVGVSVPDSVQGLRNTLFCTQELADPSESCLQLGFEADKLQPPTPKGTTQNEPRKST